jgi:hypothetical protein
VRLGACGFRRAVDAVAKFALAYAGQTSDVGGMRALTHFQLTPSIP